MGEAYSIALENTGLLAELCGVQDYNLKILERLLGHNVFTRGNEIFIEAPEPETRELFHKLISEFYRALQEGIPGGPDLLYAIHASLTSDSPECARASCSEIFMEASIQVPGAYSRVFPRTIRQALLLKGMESHDISFAVGPAGTGKTYLAIAWALREVLGKSRRKLVLTRPVVEAGESLGFLPGDLAQKISPYLRPLYDAMESILPFETVRRMEESNIIEIAPLAYMRGRSLNNACIILDEAQNTTKEQMKMFLTRLGEGSAAVITGDTSQIDLPRKSDSGLVHALSLIERIDGIFVCRLDGRDVVRNDLVRRIIEAYETEP